MGRPRLSDRLQKEHLYVAEHLGGKVICDRCGATLDTFADACSADLCDICPGFTAIDQAKAAFNRLPSGAR